MASFGNLYDYKTKNGTIIPVTANVKSTIEQAFKDIFGSDLSIEAETPMGRLVEALTFLFVDVLGVNAQNANSFNPEVAAGQYLDSLGKLWGISRYDDESDADYRTRLLDSQSRGGGFAQSIRQALSEAIGNHASCVLNNGHKDIAVLPDSTRGIPVDGHSVYICVDCDDTEEALSNVAEAIRKTVSAGCGFSDNGYGIKVVRQVEDESGNTMNITFFRPEKKHITIEVTVKPGNFTGNDIETSTIDAINEYIGQHKMNSIVTKDEIASAIGGSGLGIVCTSVSMKIGTSSFNRIVLRPSEVLVVDNITVNL